MRSSPVTDDDVDCAAQRRDDDDADERHYFEPSLFAERPPTPPPPQQQPPPTPQWPKDVHAAFLAANLLLLYLNLARLSTMPTDDDARPLPAQAAIDRDDRRDDRDRDADSNVE